MVFPNFRNNHGSHGMTEPLTQSHKVRYTRQIADFEIQCSHSIVTEDQLFWEVMLTVDIAHPRRPTHRYQPCQVAVEEQLPASIHKRTIFKSLKMSV